MLPKEKHIRLCFVGHMLGKNAGRVVSQGEIQADLFIQEGYSVRLTSTIPSRNLTAFRHYGVTHRLEGKS